MKRKISLLIFGIISIMSIVGCSLNTLDVEDNNKDALSPSAEASVKENNIDNDYSIDSEPDSNADYELELARLAEEEEKKALSNCYSAYLSFLQSNLQLASKDYEMLGEELPIAFCDIYGDSLPEMIYKEVREDGLYNLDLHIVTYSDDQILEIYRHDSIVNTAGGSNYYYLFTVNNEKNPYFMHRYAGEEKSIRYFRLIETDNALNENIVVSENIYPDYYDSTNKYAVNDTEVSEEEATEVVNDLKNNAFQIIVHNIKEPSMYSSEFDNEEYSFIQANSFIAMSYEDALKYLKNEISNLGFSNEDDKCDFSIFASIPHKYIFASGAGAWSTEITISEDGSFAGYYYDTDAGLSGNGFDGTTYYADFSGQFTNIQKINEYTYSFELDSLTYKDEIGSERIEGEDFKMKYIASEAYGIAGGKTFYLYIKGAPISELPEEFIDWVNGPMATNYHNQEDLPIYGLYNVSEEEGFFGF